MENPQQYPDIRLQVLTCRQRGLPAAADLILYSDLKLLYRLDRSTVLKFPNLAESKEAALIAQPYPFANGEARSELFLIQFAPAMGKMGKEFPEIYRGKRGKHPFDRTEKREPLLKGHRLDLLKRVGVSQGERAACGTVQG